MDEPGKSDSRLRPEKVPNNARRRAAEGLEERRLSKRIRPQATTLRTLGRARVHAALGRVWQAAQQKKGVRFTALLHHIYAIDTLQAAFHELKRDAAPGADGQTWEHYGEQLEENLTDCRADCDAAPTARNPSDGYTSPSVGTPRSSECLSIFHY